MDTRHFTHPEAVGFGGLSRDNYIRSMVEVEKNRENTYPYDSLTEAEKNEFVTINGRRYVKKIAHNRGLI